MAQHDVRAGAEAANRLIGRIQEILVDQLQPGQPADETAAFYEIVALLETSKDLSILRMALDDDPARFGEPTPVAAGDHTG